MKQCVILAISFILFIGSVVLSFSDGQFYYVGVVLFMVIMFITAFGRQLNRV